MDIDEIIKGFRCETCCDERVFGKPPNDSADNLYLYIDMSGATRCFCKDHMTYGSNKKPGLLNFGDAWEYPAYGAKLISDILSKHLSTSKVKEEVEISKRDGQYYEIFAFECECGCMINGGDIYCKECMKAIKWID